MALGNTKRLNLQSGFVSLLWEPYGASWCVAKFHLIVEQGCSVV